MKRTAHPIEISTRRFECSHGRKPTGRGTWAFQLGNLPDLFWHNGLYTEAKKAAIAHARETGFSGSIYVMP